MSSQCARVNMLKQQLRPGDVLAENVLGLFEALPREEFVPQAMRAFAYSDMQIPLAHGQQMMTPLEEGLLLQALDLKGGETVLEIGTGSGYLTALLSRSCKHVISVEYFADLSQKASANLKAHHCENVELIVNDGSRGWLEKAPYDVVVMTGAIQHVDSLLPLQILPGGKLIVIEGTAPVMTCRLFTLNHAKQWHERLLFETNTPLLINERVAKEFIF